MSDAASSSSSSGKWGKWGRSAFDKSIKLSDWASGYANAGAAKIGAERFWPRSNDTEEEIAKCERILRAFTVEGITAKDEKEEEVADGKGNIIKKKRKVLKKIPPAAIRNAKGIVIYTAMRSGIAPFGGAGGTGLMMARLPDGSWSAPNSVSPNNLAVGLLLGFDVFNVILLLNTEKAVNSFKTLAKVTMGAEMAIAAGPMGAGTSAETGIDRAPIYSYVQSRGLYAGVEAMAQAFLCRFDENERFYYWPGIKAVDILEGKVRIPPSVYPLHRALKDAETGAAQGGKLERTVYDVVKVPESEVISRINGYKPSPKPSRRPSHHGEGTADGEAQVHDGDAAADEGQELELPDEDEDMLHDGERLRLPPTPAELEALEAAGIPDEEDIRLEQQERAAVYRLEPPPMHHKIRTHWDQHPTKRRLRPTRQLVQGGVWGARAREDPANVPLPPSPWEVPLPPSPELRVEELDEVDGKEKAAFLPPPVRTVGGASPRRSVAADAASEASGSSHTPILPPPRRQDGKGAGAPATTTQDTADNPNEVARGEAAELDGNDSPAPIEHSAESMPGAAPSPGAREEGEETEVPVASNVESESQADAVMEAAAAGEVTEESQPETIAAVAAEGDVEPEPTSAEKQPLQQEDKPTAEEDTPATPQSPTPASVGVSRASSVNSGILPPPPRRPPRSRGGPPTSKA